MTLPLLFLSPVLCWAAQALLKTWQEILTSLWAFLACFSSNFLCFFAPIFPDTWNSGTSSASSSSATLHKRQILNHLSKVPWRRLQCCLGKQQQMKRRHTHFRQDPFRWKKEKKNHTRLPKPQSSSNKANTLSSEGRSKDFLDPLKEGFS